MEVLKPYQIEQAVELLKNNQIVAFPTETVYGLGAPIFNEDSIKKIFSTKGRPSDNPLIAHISHLDQIPEIALSIPSIFYELAERFFPGPLTVILKKHPRVPLIASGGRETIGIRMPSHPIAHDLIQRLGQPIVAPSANLSGRPSSTSFQHVLDDFKDFQGAIIDGGVCFYGIESTVISLTSNTPCILRYGCISQQEIELHLGIKLGLAQDQDLKASPGTRYQHYTPQTKIKLFQNKQDLMTYVSQKTLLKQLFLSTEFLEGFHTVSAFNLYALLREADRNQMDEIVLFCLFSNVNPALKDRLSRIVF